MEPDDLIDEAIGRLLAVEALLRKPAGLLDGYPGGAEIAEVHRIVDKAVDDAQAIARRLK